MHGAAPLLGSQCSHSPRPGVALGGQPPNTRPLFWRGLAGEAAAAAKGAAADAMLASAGRAAELAGAAAQKANQLATAAKDAGAVRAVQLAGAAKEAAGAPHCARQHSCLAW
jgi:hypothetical protein